MITLPNFLSLLRAPLALVFLSSNPIYRATAIILAMLTDGLDGFLARKYQMSSRVGTLLDPLMDRFFVFFIVAVLVSEGNLSYFEITALFCRDISVILFGFYLIFTQKLSRFKFRAIWCGKVTTSLQFLVLLAFTFKIEIPSYTYSLFILLGVLALLELYLSKHEEIVT